MGLRRWLRLVGVFEAKFPRVLAEGAVEPDDRSASRVWHPLDDLTLADGAGRRQARRSGTIAHVSKCRRRRGSAQVLETVQPRRLTITRVAPACRAHDPDEARLFFERKNPDFVCEASDKPVDAGVQLRTTVNAAVALLLLP